MSGFEKIGWILVSVLVTVLLVIKVTLPHKTVHTDITAYSEEVYYGSSDQLPINRISAKNLTMIPGIGESTANAIVLYRTENGAFHSYEELILVNGIGKSKLETIKNYFHEKGY